MVVKHAIRTMTSVIATVSAACLTVALASCAGSPTTAQSSAQNAASPGATAQSQGAGGGAAAVRPRTMNEYIDAIMAQSYTTDAQRAALQRAKDTGSLSASEYEKAWSDFEVCFTGLGHDPIPLTNYNGIYGIPGFNAANLTTEEQDRFFDDLNQCRKSIMPITAVYHLQQGNPSMMQTMDEAVLDCLKRAGKVGNEVTALDIAADKNSETPTHFDQNDPVVRGCQASNGWKPTDEASRYKITR